MITRQGAARRAILVVEDESLLRMMAVDLFEDAGFRVIEASTGDEAAQLLTSADVIDCLFTDIEMPGTINGIALARMAHEIHPNAAVIVVSARATPKPGELPPNATFIDKPYGSEAVLIALSNLLLPEADTII
jgi:CheY-like chemotaxis protein